MYITARQLSERLGLSRATLYRMRDRGDLPKPRKLTGNTVRWRLSEIEEWEDDLDTCFMTEVQFELFKPQQQA